MKKILVPTDFSECAQNATDFACELAIQRNCSVTLLHSSYLYHTESAALLSINEEMLDTADRYLKEEIQRVTSKYPELEKVGIDVVSTLGDLEIEVAVLEGKGEYNLVVMGTKGKSGWEELLIGSETVRLLDSLTLPAILVPLFANFGKASKLLFAATLEEDISQEEFDLLQELSQNEARISIFHNYENIIDIDSKGEQELIKRFQQRFQTGVDLELDFNSEKANSVEDYIEKINPDLVVVRKENKGFFEDLFATSVSKTLSYHIKVPMLVLRQPT